MPLFPHHPDGGNDCTYLIELLWGLNELIYVTHLEQCLTHIKNYASVGWYYYYHLKECSILFMVGWGSTKLCQGLLSHLSHPCTLLHPSREAQTMFEKQVVVGSCKYLGSSIAPLYHNIKVILCFLLRFYSLARAYVFHVTADSLAYLWGMVLFGKPHGWGKQVMLCMYSPNQALMWTL